MADEDFFNSNETGTDASIKSATKIKAEPVTQNQNATKKRGRGRKSKVDLEREKLEKQEQERELSQKRLQAFREPVNTGLRVLFNDALFSRLPKEAEISPLSDPELNALTDALVPVLDQLGWLDSAGNPYLNLTLVSFAIFYPRVNQFSKYKRYKRIGKNQDSNFENKEAKHEPEILKSEKKDVPQQKRTKSERVRKP